MKSQIFPYDEELKLSKFSDWLGELEKLNRIIPFSIDDEKYYYIPKFEEHQKVDRPSKTRNPEPPKDIGSRVFRESLASVAEKKALLTDTITDTITDTTCAESRVPREAAPLILSIPISGNGVKEFQINQKMIDEWSVSYPGIDVLQELRKCREWNRANPKKQKTKIGVSSHIVSWLGRAQDRYKKPITDECDGPRSKILRAPDGI